MKPMIASLTLFAAPLAAHPNHAPVAGDLWHVAANAAGAVLLLGVILAVTRLVKGAN